MHIDGFAENGFVKIEEAAPREVAEAAQRKLWNRIPMAPDRPESWTEPVVWAADLRGDGPFGVIAGSRRVADALDAICGVDGWQPRGSLGNVPVRFPVPPVADDRGWHVDLNTPLPDGTWAVSGRPHTVLLLTILSEVGADDAPTRLRSGSHRDVATVLGERPVDAYECGPLVEEASAHRKVVLATGSPGDVYVVHPFTVHAADEHRGHTPRFMAQAPVLLAEPLSPRSSSLLGSAWWT
ncbi:mitomycin antibiotics/polyketide fumonisin biosynthesis protein [Mycolicibacterium sp. P1-18]|uniref:phytanoyl-CoA dioxygenase family protein n=1 Tax=Mycolicibacterium sp. P1-18 TaxID=2024615 RepID=UPI0011F24B8E|nr:phytanoyl-CoA dioxygenase family protein [Mycolicibacterium sp. P1-18]KAA0095951.1 mitomycin antibiotics/polyketide fumonisin biosynthesis protein [Mycolicibacterium sp. P1-18]